MSIFVFCFDVFFQTIFGSAIVFDRSSTNQADHLQPSISYLSFVARFLVAKQLVQSFSVSDEILLAMGWFWADAVPQRATQHPAQYPSKIAYGQPATPPVGSLCFLTWRNDLAVAIIILTCRLPARMSDAPKVRGCFEIFTNFSANKASRMSSSS